MGIVSNVGLGSGLNISQLVGQLVEAERAGPSLIINRKEARANAQISALGTLSGAFSKLQTALNGLKSPTLFTNRVITSADSERVAVRASGTPAAALGSFEIEVETLAQSQKLRSAAVADADAAIGQGTLQIVAGDQTIDVTIDGDNDSLRGLASAINTAAGGKGVQASLVLGDDGYNLVLSAVQSGSEGTLTITQTDGTTLSAFENANLTEVTAATDAVFYIDGLKRTSSSNIVADAVQGLELTLVKQEVGVTTKVTIGQDSGAPRRAIESFVTAYNSAIDAISTTTAYDAEKNVAAALNGDSTVRSASQQMRRELGTALTALAESGVTIGLDTELSGKLKFDASAFNAAYTASPGAVEALFDGEDGALFSALNPVVSALSSDTGSLARRDEQLKATVRQAGEQREALERRMTLIEERYRARFVALDSMLGQLQSTSSYLSQQLANLPSPQS